MSGEKMCVFAKRPVFTLALDFPEGPVQAGDGPKRELGTGGQKVWFQPQTLPLTSACLCESHHWFWSSHIENRRNTRSFPFEGLVYEATGRRTWKGALPV